MSNTFHTNSFTKLLAVVSGGSKIRNPKVPGYAEHVKFAFVADVTRRSYVCKEMEYLLTRLKNTFAGAVALAIREGLVK